MLNHHLLDKKENASVDIQAIQPETKVESIPKEYDVFAELKVERPATYYFIKFMCILVSVAGIIGSSIGLDYYYWSYDPKIDFSETLSNQVWIGVRVAPCMLYTVLGLVMNGLPFIKQVPRFYWIFYTLFIIGSICSTAFLPKWAITFLFVCAIFQCYFWIFFIAIRGTERVDAMNPQEKIRCAKGAGFIILGILCFALLYFETVRTSVMYGITRGVPFVLWLIVLVVLFIVFMFGCLS